MISLLIAVVAIVNLVSLVIILIHAMKAESKWVSCAAYWLTVTVILGLFTQVVMLG